MELLSWPYLCEIVAARLIVLRRKARMVITARCLAIFICLLKYRENSPGFSVEDYHGRRRRSELWLQGAAVLSGKIAL